MRNPFPPKTVPAESYPTQLDGTSGVVTRPRGKAATLLLASALALTGCGTKQLDTLPDKKTVTLNKGAAVKVLAVEGSEGFGGEKREVEVEACAGDIKSGFLAGIEDEDKQTGCTNVDVLRTDWNKLKIGAPVVDSTVTLPKSVPGTVDV